MIKVGITGEMGSGKSYISNLFAKKGVPIYNCDKGSKNLVTTNQNLIADIKKYFGETIYDGNVFKNLSDMVFPQGNEEHLKTLSALIHPYIYEDIDKFCEKHSEDDFCLIESAILYETKMDLKLDMVIYVSAVETVRIKRAIERDKITEKEYHNRMKAQLPIRDKLKKATYIVYNSGIENVEKKVNEIYNAINWTINFDKTRIPIYY